MGLMDTKLGRYFNLLIKAEEVRHELPLHLRPEIDDISKGLPQMGPHLRRKTGQGYEFFDMREFVSGADDPRFIHPKHSAKRGKLIYIEKEAEVRHHFYMWRDASPSMDWKSDGAPYTPKEASEIMLMGLAKHLARSQEKIGLLETGWHTQGARTAEWLAAQWSADDSTHGLPKLQRRLVSDSSAVLISDFMNPPAALESTLRELQAQRVSGWIVMIADPQVIDFDFKHFKEFTGLEGEASHKLDMAKGQSVKKAYQAALLERIALIEKISKDHGFRFILQRTDEPLHNSLLALYGLAPAKPESIQKLAQKLELT